MEFIDTNNIPEDTEAKDSPIDVEQGPQEQSEELMPFPFGFRTQGSSIGPPPGPQVPNQKDLALPLPSLSSLPPDMLFLQPPPPPPLNIFSAYQKKIMIAFLKR